MLLGGTYKIESATRKHPPLIQHSPRTARPSNRTPTPTAHSYQNPPVEHIASRRCSDVWCWLGRSKFVPPSAMPLYAKYIVPDGYSFRGFRNRPARHRTARSCRVGAFFSYLGTTRWDKARHSAVHFENSRNTSWSGTAFKTQENRDLYQQTVLAVMETEHAHDPQVGHSNCVANRISAVPADFVRTVRRNLWSYWPDRQWCDLPSGPGSVAGGSLGDVRGALLVKSKSATFPHSEGESVKALQLAPDLQRWTPLTYMKPETPSPLPRTPI